MSRRRIVASEVLRSMSEGVTKKKTTSGYVPEIGSIEEIHGLSISQVDELFRHPAFATAKTKIAPPFIVVDDVTNPEQVSAEPTELIPADRGASNSFSGGTATTSEVLTGAVENTIQPQGEDLMDLI